jgi:phage-related protein
MEKKNYVVDFYEDNRKRKLAEEFLFSIPKKARAKFIFIIDLLKKSGPELKRPYADILRDDIYELRVEFQKTQYRVLYFFIVGRKIYLSHGFLKKDWEVPRKEIEKAVRHKKIVEERRKKK